jgi:hypothetical protein
LKELSKNTKRLYHALDVSPFAYSRIKVVIFLIWGFNALVFLVKDSVIDMHSSPEQLIIVSREFFDNNIIANTAGSLEVNIIPYEAGIIVESEHNTSTPEFNLHNSSRAPPTPSLTLPNGEEI